MWPHQPLHFHITVQSKTEILCHFIVVFYEAKLYNKKNWANLSVKAVMVV